MTEVEEMAMIIARKNEEIEDLKSNLQRIHRELSTAREDSNRYRKTIQELDMTIKAQQYNADTVKALMDAHEIIRKENQELHKRVDAAFAGVAMDASARKHYLQAIIERLDGIKASVEVVLKE